MQHLAWTRHGRQYHHADEGKPNTFTITTTIGQVNVDVHGDGSEYSPYVLDGARLRHGDGECEFADGFQTIRRLGQALVSRSRLYVQRLVGGAWTDVPHGIPTRNVAHDYPREGRCTAYLEFDQIQGYAAGARLQVGIEVGGGDRQRYGFRFRSPVAGTFRLEWVLEIPEDVDLVWITEPVDRHDPGQGIIRVGGRIGQTAIRWSRAEAPYRAATIESDGAGGRILRVLLGPYTVAAMEWLAIYPDTVTGAESEHADDIQFYYDGVWSINAGSDLWFGIWDYHNEYGTARFALSGAIPSGAVIDTDVGDTYIRYTGAGDANIDDLRLYVTESADAPQSATAAARPNFEDSGSTTLYPATYEGTGVVSATGWPASGTKDIAIGSLIQHLVDTYGGLASGAHVCIWITAASTEPNEAESEYVPYDVGSNYPTLTITYTAGGGTTLVVPDLSHAHTLDAPVLTQKHTLAVADLGHGHGLEGPGVTQKHLLALAELSHSHVLDAPSLTQKHVLTSDDLVHSHVLDPVSLTQKHVLTVADLSHVHLLDGISLGAAIELEVQELSHTHTLDPLVLTQKHALTVADLIHTHGLDPELLIQKHNLTVNDLLHAQVVDNVTISSAITLIISNLIHSHGLDTPSLTQKHVLVVGDLAHSQTLDNVSLGNVILIVADLLHSQILDAGGDLVQDHHLVVSDLIHLQAIDLINLEALRSLQRQRVPILLGDLASVVRQINLRLDEADSVVALVYKGKGSPEGVVRAPVGSIYLRLDGSGGSVFYVKESNMTGSTGWVAK
jgi:hypothetical protein